VAYKDYSRGGGTTIGVLLSMAITIAIIGNPGAVVQFASLVSDLGWMNAVTLVVVIFGGSIIELMLMQFHDGQVWKQIIHHYFQTFHENNYEPIDIKLEHTDLQTIGRVLRDPVKGMF
jgi:hypothetical protein